MISNPPTSVANLAPAGGTLNITAPGGVNISGGVTASDFWGAAGANAVVTAWDGSGAGVIAPAISFGGDGAFATGGTVLSRIAAGVLRLANNQAVVNGLALANGSTLWSGAGAPAAGLGGNGDVYFRNDTPGTANQRMYVKSAGAWVGIA